VGGASLAGAATYAATQEHDQPSVELTWGDDTLPFHGEHQAGIETPAQSLATFVAVDLLPGVDREAAGRLMRLWSDDAARLMSGAPALADPEVELALRPARLTATFGFGPRFFERLGLRDRRPAGLTELPRLSIDRLEHRWSDGDLLVHVGGDDPTSVAHATRMLLKDARAFATVRWVQRGFRHARGATEPGSTPRNLMGQVDGTVNPVPGSPEFAQVVWADEEHPWFRGGTTLVVRRISMDLDRWDKVDRSSREQVIGRRLSDGAPMTGGHEQTPVDLDAVGADGLPVIPSFAHTRRARAHNPQERFLRRSYSYDESPGATSVSDAGLIFCAYQSNIGEQFLPIQRRLSTFDLLNDWTTPVGSAIFALPRGCRPGGWIGEDLLN
jgi:dye decolorizing peroxidase